MLVIPCVVVGGKSKQEIVLENEFDKLTEETQDGHRNHAVLITIQVCLGKTTSVHDCMNREISCPYYYLLILNTST